MSTPAPSALCSRKEIPYDKKVKNWKWILLAVCALFAIGGGLILGKVREKDYIGQLYSRATFTLLDDTGAFFDLAKFPEGKKLLLVFTPDGIPPSTVKPFYEFSRQLKKLADMEVVLVTRTNREIARNFKTAAHFPGRMLLDPSGTVGRLAGIWPGMEPVEHWGYVLTDRSFQLYWGTVEKAPIGFQQLQAGIATASKPTSNASP